MPFFEWSTPVRHNGVERLTPIPNEIYLQIFDYSRTTPVPQTQLKNLSLVCRFFYVVTMPKIWEKMKFVPEDRSDQSVKRRSIFSKVIRKGDKSALALAKNVKRCSFVNWGEGHISNPRWCFDDPISLHSKALQSMQNVRELSLRFTPITRSLITSMAMLPRLESLKVDFCFLAGEIILTDFSPLSSLKLKGLRSSPSEVTDISRRCDAMFDYLNLNFLEEAYSYDDHIIPHLLGITGDLPLVKLVFKNLQNVDDLAKLLAKTPALQIFHVHSVKNSKALLEIGSCSLPELKSLIVPGTGFNALINMGHVQEVIFDDSITLPDFQSLSNPFRPYTSMTVPADVYLGIPFWEHFSEITTLKVTFDAFNRNRFWENDEVDQFVSRWPNYPPTLRTLVLDFKHRGSRYPPIIFHTNSSRFEFPAPKPSMPDVDREYHWIADVIFPKFLSLRQCRFGDSYQWFYVEEDNMWKPEIVPGTEWMFRKESYLVDDQYGYSRDEFLRLRQLIARNFTS